MNIRLRHLLPVLLGAALACAETPQSNQAGRTAQADGTAIEHASLKTGAKTAPVRSATDGRTNESARPAGAPPAQSVEVKYTVTQLDATPKQTGSWMSLSSGDVTVIVVVFVVLALVIWLARMLLRRGDSQASQGRAPVATQDSQQLAQAVGDIRLRMGSLATSSALASAQTSINANITSLGNALVPKITEAAIAAMAKSELGELRQKLSTALSDLQKAKGDLDAKDSQLESATGSQRSAQDALNKVEGEKAALSLRLSTIEGDNQLLKNDLAAAQGLVTTTKADAESQKAAAEKLRAEANKGFEVLAPAKLKDTELLAQMQALYQQSLAGSAASIAAWTTLTTFASAQADPSAKDFQLQIVRRLGLTLVNYWKQQGLTEKERHDKLVNWAKSLNEHADGRYNLLVPSLGEPVDRSRMSCATTVMVVREVLCWQVRNPAGANFSLAEVA